MQHGIRSCLRLKNVQGVKGRHVCARALVAFLFDLKGCEGERKVIFPGVKIKPGEHSESPALSARCGFEYEGGIASGPHPGTNLGRLRDEAP